MANPIKIATFNILNGGGDEQRFRGILQVIRQMAPDVLVLQECLDWEENGARVQAVAEAVGSPGCIARSRARGSGKSYHLGLFTNLPVLDLRIHNDPAFLGHSIAHLKLNWGGDTLNVIGAHFDSKNENLRFVEARYLRSLLDQADFNQGLYALAGDLNALSRHDPYPADLEKLLRESMTSKFHLPPRFEVMEELADFGWVDGLYLKPPARWVTAPRDRGGVQIDYRTDYLLFSPRLAQRVGQVEVVPVGNESDHYPVQAVLF
ncbi:endonuclease/exonuclease/phosphatase family protein [bacterium]|nr:endonuclease/exonuclease/phosphatase family protein [bacterium]